MAERDYSYEALAVATNTDMAAGRGELNISLKTIRAQETELTDYALADEIHRRAVLYRETMGDGILLTATALAKHWGRVEAQRPKPPPASNQHSAVTRCELCGGDRFVVVAKREQFDEYAPCPDCHPVDASFFRYDGSRMVPPDPARVREMMKG